MKTEPMEGESRVSLRIVSSTPRPTSGPTSGMLTPREAAKRLGISTATVRSEVQAGRIRASRFGSRDMLIRPSDLEEYIQACEGKALLARG